VLRAERGAVGLFSVGSPATAKNALSIGASQTSKAGWNLVRSPCARLPVARLTRRAQYFESTAAQVSFSIGSSSVYAATVASMGAPRSLAAMRCPPHTDRHRPHAVGHGD
jgi:hypothetical protein